MASDAIARSSTQAELNRKSQLSRFTKIIYGSGAMVDGMANAALGFLFFYMTAVRGLSGGLAGASMVVALLVDSAVDPLIGSFSDATRSRFGRRHPWMLIASFPLALSLGLLFSAPASLTRWALFAYMTLAAIGVRVSLSLFAVPHVALGAELSDGYMERSHIVAYRTVFNVLALLVAPALAYVVFMPSTSDLLHSAGYVPFAWSCAAIVVVSGIFCTLGTRDTLSRLHVAVAKVAHPLLRFLQEMGEIFRHRHFVILFFGSLIYFTSQGLYDQLGIHNAKFFWNLSNGEIQLLVVANAMGGVAGFPLAAHLQRYVDKHHLLVLTLVLKCTGSAIAPFLLLGGILPAAGPGLMAPLFVLRILDGIAMVIVGITYYSMTADAADEHEYLFGARREGLFFSGLAFSSKAASALGAFIAGQALDLIGFPVAIAAKGAHFHIAHTTIVELGLIAGPGAAILMASPAVLVLLIRFSRADLAQLQAELSARRKAAAARARENPSNAIPVAEPIASPAAARTLVPTAAEPGE